MSEGEDSRVGTLHSMPTANSEPSMQESEARCMVPALAGSRLVATNMPAIIARAGAAAAFAWEDFFLEKRPTGHRSWRSSFLRDRSSVLKCVRLTRS